MHPAGACAHGLIYLQQRASVFEEKSEKPSISFINKPIIWRHEQHKSCNQPFQLK
ncbi:hypothetical protein WICANDRAFT_97550 [Wickerhamomyces anomalus NRRL Y-366-8]|uniref:Uncharacterized protein n=1 Tax=Wickerhamomyces anomalus (strain ATCC 58044 / CBS 1984 / NCYC 433 / NRRL Y-366-8) TaxID=683960 RepID=A0A1E3NVB7_WICAA|nr:uncharacterized protein WICANDRAFT_97550 [Wickerhamomyces anomalus NRRL Y-366-8]ODQ57045.1 hypothetical protein WICANDRAFT_97550 [Wickerhamomyces anomalus NRRL Y-366-8]